MLSRGIVIRTTDQWKYPRQVPITPSFHDGHSRNVLPWVNEARNPLDEQIDPEVKKEQIRMLEREFVGAGKGAGKGLGLKG